MVASEQASATFVSADIHGEQEISRNLMSYSEVTSRDGRPRASVPSSTGWETRDKNSFTRSRETCDKDDIAISGETCDEDDFQRQRSDCFKVDFERQPGYPVWSIF